MEIPREKTRAFNEMLVDYLRQCKFTNEDIAEIFGYSTRTITRWRTGENIPDILVIIGMCFLFKLSYVESVRFLHSADISLYNYPVYESLLRNYQYADIEDVNRCLKRLNYATLTIY